jgi:hypothetical protein
MCSGRLSSGLKMTNSKKLTMPSVSLSFKVHIPYRLQKITPASIGSTSCYFDASANKLAVDKLSDECYLPANKILYSLVKRKIPDRFFHQRNSH